MLGSILLTFACSILAVTGYANPGACSGSCVVHDPSVCKRASDGTYYRFSTGNKIQISTASSLSGPWTIKGSALPSGSSINLAGNQDLWAPDVQLVGSTYYMYYAVSTFGSQSSAIGLATSTSMDVGTWTDHGAVTTSSSGAAYNAIDPNLVFSGSTPFLTFGSFWNDLYQIQLSTALTSTSGSAYQLAFNSSGTHAEEGSTIYYRSPYYYLFFSSGICCGYDTSRPAPGAEYRINVCRSSSVGGPYVDKNGVSCKSSGGTTVLASHDNVYGPGGQGIFVDSSQGGAVLYYHYINPTIGYGDGQTQFGWNVIGWSGGWPAV